MAEENKYTLTTDKGEARPCSKGYTGKGVAVYPNGDIYDGDFVDGVREGKGKYTYAGGETPDRYEGYSLYSRTVFGQSQTWNRQNVLQRKGRVFRYFLLSFLINQGISLRGKETARACSPI